MRLSKFLALCGFGSRRKNKDLILQGRVVINGFVVTDLSYKVDLDKDKVLVDGQEVKPQPKFITFFINPRDILLHFQTLITEKLLKIS